MQSLFSDLQYSARELRKRPGFVLTAVLSLALGIGATSAVFSVIYAVLIDPFPYPGAERMMEIRLLDKNGNTRYTGFNGPQIQQLRQAKTVESVVGMDYWNLTTTDGDIPEDVQTTYITPDYPNHWGMAALYGRWLVPSDAPFGRDPQSVVVLATNSGSATTSAIPTSSAAPSNSSTSPIRSSASCLRASNGPTSRSISR